MKSIIRCPRILIGALAFGLTAGCETAPKNVPVEQPVQTPPAVYPLDTPKPLPDQTAEEPPAPAYNDPPLVDQRLPEESWFVGTYNHVGRPRIAVFVNRTLEGNVIADQGYPLVTSETVQSANGNVDVQHSEGGGYSDAYGGGGQHESDSFKTNGPAEYHQTTTVYLHPGQYDAADLQALDYSEMESRLTEWLGCEGQIVLVSPDYVRGHLTDQQVNDLQSGKAAGLKDLSQATGADILIQIQAHPVRRGDQLVVLLIGQAVNVRGGESLAQASVEMPTPIDRYALNNYTRFLARKLIHGMVGAWTAGPPVAPPATQP